MPALPFREVWCVDFEFGGSNGDRPAARCMVALEFFTRRLLRVWLDGQQPPSHTPFRIDADTLFVSYFGTADLSCFLSLGWQLPVRVLDLYAEFKRHICGRDGEPKKPSLVYALDWFGLDSMDSNEKEDMRQLALRGGPYSDDERRNLMDYCEADVRALPRLLDALRPDLDVPRAVLRGEFVKAMAHVEHNGIPVDVQALTLLNENWQSLKLDMIRVVDVDFGVFDGTHFRAERFTRWLDQHDLPWPRTTAGLELNDETFKDMAERYPKLQPLRQLRQALDILRLADLPVGRDGRNRCLMSPFGTITGRCAPSTSQFIFSRPAWMRSLVRPENGRALAYIDWVSQEYGIGALLSGDQSMTADYEAGDPYLGFAKRIKLIPAGATKKSHQSERSVIKAVILGTQYGMAEQTLAARINKPVIYARELLRAHRMTYRKFWEWSDAAVNVGLFHGRLWTRFGWQSHTRYGRTTIDESGDPNVRSLSNFPCQGNAADMLRLAAGFICDAGLQLDATIHDAVLIEADVDRIDTAVEVARRQMNRASELVLSGYTLRTDVELIRWPDRYRDDRGAAFFDQLMCRLESRLESSHRREERTPS
jgi:DNA polymerase-1